MCDQWAEGNAAWLHHCLGAGGGVGAACLPRHVEPGPHSRVRRCSASHGRRRRAGQWNCACSVRPCRCSVVLRGQVCGCASTVARCWVVLPSLCCARCCARPRRCVWDSLTPAASGGAVGVLNGASILVVASTLANNTAVSGGAMLVSGTSSAQVTNSELSHNTAAAPLGTQAAAPGGALIVQDNAVVILTHATVTLNTAGDYGGAVYVAGRAPALSRQPWLTARPAPTRLRPPHRHLLGYAELQAYASQISDNTAVEGAGM